MDERLAAIEALARKAEAVSPAPIDFAAPIAPPRWLPRNAYVMALSQLLHAERATGRVCKMLAGRVPEPEARRFLRTQAADEARHAALYNRYLGKLGDTAPMDPAFADAVDAGLTWDGPAEGIIALFHIVIEGEAIALQGASTRHFSCPLLARITAAVTRDEARHVAFGRHYLAHSLSKISSDERRAIHRGIEAIWRRTAANGTGGGITERAIGKTRRRYMEERWSVHAAALARAGLSAA